MRWIKNTFIIPETIGPYDKSSIMYNETLRLCPACEVRIDSHKTVLQSLATLSVYSNQRSHSLFLGMLLPKRLRGGESIIWKLPRNIHWKHMENQKGPCLDLLQPKWGFVTLPNVTDPTQLEFHSRCD